MMKLTAENYYSPEADRLYLSETQFKNFAGTLGREGCEAAAMARLDGSWKYETNSGMLVGSYVDAWTDGPKALEAFKETHPQMIGYNGQLRPTYAVADRMVRRISRSPFFMFQLAGEKQVIMTGSLFGAEWKIRMDSYFPGEKIVDLKTARSFDPIHGLHPALYWGYDIQGAVYQAIVEANTGEHLPFYLAVVTWDLDIQVIHVGDDILRDALDRIRIAMPRVLAVKSGEETPRRCEHCNYCRSTKVLTGPVELADLIGDHNHNE